MASLKRNLRISIVVMSPTVISGAHVSISQRSVLRFYLDTATSETAHSCRRRARSPYEMKVTVSTYFDFLFSSSAAPLRLLCRSSLLFVCLFVCGWFSLFQYKNPHTISSIFISENQILLQLHIVAVTLLLCSGRWRRSFLRIPF